MNENNKTKTSKTESFSQDLLTHERNGVIMFNKFGTYIRGIYTTRINGLYEEFLLKDNKKDCEPVFR